MVEGAEGVAADGLGDTKRCFAATGRRAIIDAMVFDQVSAPIGPSCTQSFHLPALIFLQNRIAVAALSHFRGEGWRRFLRGHFDFLAKRAEKTTATARVTRRGRFSLEHLEGRASIPDRTVSFSRGVDERAADAGVIGFLRGLSRGFGFGRHTSL